MANNITIKALDELAGRTFRIPDEQKLTGETLSPFVAELTDNGVLFLRSLNKSYESLKVGYMVLGNNTIRRHESANGYTRPTGKGKKGRWGWSNYAPGCFETSLTFADLVLCSVEKSVYDLSEYDRGPILQPYEPPQEPKSVLPQVAKEATLASPEPAGDNVGWVMI